MIRSRLQFGMTFTGSRFRFVFDTSSTPSRATGWLAVHRSTWSSYATPWLTFQKGATFGRRPRFSSWSLDIGKNDPGKEVSLSPHRSCGTYFLPTSDFSTMSINFSGRLKTRYMQQSMLCHWGSMSTVWTSLLLLPNPLYNTSGLQDILYTRGLKLKQHWAPHGTWNLCMRATQYYTMKSWIY